jgi:hypothetical protein
MIFSLLQKTKLTNLVQKQSMFGCLQVQNVKNCHSHYKGKWENTAPPVGVLGEAGGGSDKNVINTTTMANIQCKKKHKCINVS